MNRLPNRSLGKEKAGRKKGGEGRMGEKMGRPYNGCLTYGPQNITTHKNKAIKVFLMTSVYRISQLLFIFLGSLRHVSVLLNAVHIRNNRKAYYMYFNNESLFVPPTSVALNLAIP